MFVYELRICCKLVVLKISGIWTMRPICLFLNLDNGYFYTMFVYGLWLFMYYISKTEVYVSVMDYVSESGLYHVCFSTVLWCIWASPFRLC
jgi:hypothetical protein